ncbi:MAG: asparagine synthase (glutamine-hydrolyzing) [Candidatus Omnitrophica bacterium]|nr:asparagine synthase (glutamine-hydrolyzing) [Candidatus Omnitrophota bacterium]
MSGLAAILSLDGRPVERPMLTRMSQAMVHRGADGEGAWVHGSVGLAHRRLCLTPESWQERQPVVDGHYGLVWDGRLDNREELLRDLSGATDPELVLAAYQRWGPECPRHLVGEFAFVVWDSQARRLFAARDPLGLRPLHYCVANQTLCLSSEIKPILAVLDRMPAPDDEMVFAFLLRELREPDHARTFFQSVHRLPPGHALLARDAAVSVRRYWTIDPTRQLRYARDEDYVERFRGLFEEAVRCRLRSAFPVGCFLSGGLDSSSIACVAVRQTGVPLEAIVVVGNQPEADERRFAAAVAQKLGVRLHEAARGTDEPLNGLEEEMWRVECPAVGTNRHGGRDLMEWLRSRNLRVLLTGIGGDQVVDEYGYFTDLLTHRPWRFVTELNQFARWYGGDRWELTQTAFADLIPAQGKGWLKRIMRKVPPSWLNARLARQARLFDRLHAPRVSIPFPSSVQTTVYLNTFSPYQVLSREVDERTVACYGLEVRYPFYDARLVEFLLAIPWDRRTRQGERKWLLRQAMRGLVPESIRLRKGKGDYTSSMDDGLLALCQQQSPAALLDRSGLMDRYLDRRGAERLVAQFRQGASEKRWALWSLISLDRFLERFWNNGGTDAQTQAVGQEALHPAAPAGVR